MAINPNYVKDLHVPHSYVKGSEITVVKNKDHLGYIVTEDFADN